jgi:hypothetical protein
MTREKNNLPAHDSFGSSGLVAASTAREAYLQPDSLLLLPCPKLTATALPQKNSRDEHQKPNDEAKNR